MDKTLQNTYSQTWSWQQHAAGLLFCDRITQMEGRMQKNTVKTFLPERPRSHNLETQECEKKAVSS